jgi:Phage major capsid protein E
MVNIRNLFAREAIIQYLQILGPMFPRVCMDRIFTRRPQQPGPLIGSDIVKQFIKAMALSRRGAPAISITGAAGTTQFYEPLPIHPKIQITGADLNNLRLFSQDGANSKQLLEVWARNKTEVLRQTVGATTEAMCAIALTGKLAYPVQLEGGGYDSFSIDYGTVQTVPTGSYTFWDDPAVKPMDVLALLIAMRKTFQRIGVGGEIVWWAGEDAFTRLFGLVSRILTSTKLVAEAGIPMALDQNFIMIGTIKIELRSEEYVNPQTGDFTPIIPKNVLKAIALDAGHQLPYASIDDLDGNLQPMPFFMKPIKTDDPSGYSLIAESKPLPVVNSMGICDVVVLAA